MQKTMQKMSFRKRQIALAVAAVGAASLVGSNANAGHDDRSELRDRRTRPVSRRRLPQSHDLLRRLDLDAEARQEVDRHGRHAVGTRLVRAGRPRRQRQPQLHAGRRRHARHARLSVRRRRRPDHDMGGQHRCSRRAWKHAVEPGRRRQATTPLSSQQPMWRWQSIQEFQYPLIEYLSALQERAAVHRPRVGGGGPRAHLDVGHHRPDAASASTARAADEPAATRALGNATALAQWEYCFDRADTDTSRGASHAPATTGTAPSPAASNRRSDPSWNDNREEADSSRRHRHRHEGHRRRSRR